jgi:AraC family transcriptional regulator of adaptative response / DNA-3-methyladenine glycosylase II
VELDVETCRRASSSRDARFDGRFYAGFLPGGVYCRPICRAPERKPESARFFPTTAAAEAAGLRPCPRCRPEEAPRTPEWVGGSGTVARALRLVERGYLDGHGVAELAGELGVSERRLRRLLAAHLGAGPRALARARRARVARMLLDQTDLPFARVALAAGYGSPRRLDAEMRRSFGASPAELRRAPGAATAAAGRRAGTVPLRLPYRPPLAWGRLLAYLRARATPGVEAVEGRVYARSLRLGSASGVVALEDDPDRAQLVLHLPVALLDSVTAAVERAHDLADLDADPLAIETALAPDPVVGGLVAKTPGLRVPGTFDPFELAVRAILGQQVTVSGATTLAGRLARAFGEPLAEGSGTITHLFPEAAALAEADVARIGIPESRARAIRALAAEVASGRLRLDPTAEPAAAVAALEALPGVGPWTARYVAMRALRDPDALPATDLGLRQALARDSRPARAAEVEAVAGAWRPWRAYAAVHLWHAGAASLERAA